MHSNSWVSGKSEKAQLEEALDAITAACKVYKNAGIVQYEAYYADRIARLKAKIAALEKR